ncbi:MAG: ferrous iron transport protein B [Flavobacteriales bacterium]|jgi:ferrous iron transport protein B|uniref:ferrous iron transport protein B n=1 Tax=Blattabacterium sp. (Mastotermes darwiniensis) TaxID=39768 RepID=UPI000231DED2|nr:ferrous iron transport protein B [Blattabacterium sp. (Mastotermes darwiniensis)]AER40774.1 ferrous iron transport protein B [Blattabacterium sp. (Mastotermes darwiniensis) str. MADAR]MDR1804619.1 ferrous iron transport protein B [Flavobacteriales bacterium]
MQKKIVKLAIIGNPNVGKTSLFNKLTGLNQKIGNYLGVTVDKKIGYFYYDRTYYQIVDLPGTYSIYPSSKDEEIVSKFLLTDTENVDYPDKIIVVADSSNIKKSILLLRQIQDLGFSVLFVLNMIDEAKKKGIVIDIEKLKEFLITEIVSIDARKGIGIEKVKNKIKNMNDKTKRISFFFNPESYYPIAIQDVKTFYQVNTYRAWYYLANNNEEKILNEIKKKHNIISKRLQIKETLDRYQEISNILSKTVSEFLSEKEKNYLNFSKKIDNALLLHPLWGYFIFFFLLFIIFQSVFFWSEIPKKFIEFFFYILQKKLKNIYPGPLNNFFLQGIIPGISTIITFIPQIFILLFFILLMEESGYITRVIFLMDRMMRPFGLNGKSVVPLISSIACSIPAIMSARNIENPRDRLITILVTPFMICSARLPVYTLIISLVIPNQKWYFIQLRGVVLMAMYFLSFFSALSISRILHQFLKKDYKSHLIMEMPTYKCPIFINILITLWMNIKSFILNAGKMILLVNVLIWSLGSFGPSKKLSNQNYTFIEERIQRQTLPNSYLGLIGKKMEPFLKPLGYDWKIGIGLFSSLVAREVFVSTMTSIYSIENSMEKGNLLLEEKMKKETFPETGKPVYNLATGFSLLFFYAFSIQCISTLSIVRKETKSWKWPIMQFFFMTTLAYLFSFLIYKILK